MIIFQWYAISCKELDLSVTRNDLAVLFKSSLVPKSAKVPRPAEKWTSSILVPSWGGGWGRVRYPGADLLVCFETEENERKERLQKAPTSLTIVSCIRLSPSLGKDLTIYPSQLFYPRHRCLRRFLNLISPTSIFS